MADETTNIRSFVTQAVDLIRGKMLTSAEARVLHEAFAPLILAVQYYDKARTFDPEEAEGEEMSRPTEGDVTLSSEGIRRDERRRVALLIRASGVGPEFAGDGLLEVLEFRDMLARVIGELS